MRRPRGNILITALFVAIFLFFLSVALIVQNRQDIALSLSMEHKMRAQSAARSAAMEAFAYLKRDGAYTLPDKQTLSNGVQQAVQLVLLPPEGKRGEILLVRARVRSALITLFI